MINRYDMLQQLQQKIYDMPLQVSEKVALLNQYKELLFAHLQVGDTIEGTVKSMGNNQYMLQLKEGVTLPIQVALPLEDLQHTIFVVMGKEQGKLYLTPQTTMENTPHTLQSQTIKELQLPNNEAMKNIISDFMAKQLPLTKEILTKAYQMHMQQEIPTKVITNLVSNEPFFSLKDFIDTNQLKEDGLVKIQQDFTLAIDDLSKSEDMKNLFVELKKMLPKEKMIEIVNKLPNEFIQQLGNNKEQIAQLLQEDKLLTKLWNEPTIAKKLLLNMFKDAMMIDYKSLQMDEMQTKKIENIAKYYVQIAKTLEKADIQEHMKEKLLQWSDPIQVLHKWNIQADYFFFPFLKNNKEHQGEMYFFKPKKKDKNNKENMYIVLALEMPTLKYIEIHIRKQEKQLYLLIKTANKQINDCIQEHIASLQTQIYEMGYILEQVSCIETTESLKDTMQHSSLAELIEPLHHMDYKI